MLARRYTPSLPRYLATRAGVPGAGAQALEEVRPPALPSPEWLPVRPSLSGICGSDQALLAGRASLYLASLTSAPFVPGHEVVGDITGGAPPAGRGGGPAAARRAPRAGGGA